MKEYDVIVIGCGLSGAVAARYMAEKKGKNVLILERRSHIGGNLYDYVNDSGVLVQKYGPHIFHTNKKQLYDYICKFADWTDYKLVCGAVINNKCTPTPFNFQTIDDFFPEEKAQRIKCALVNAYPNQVSANVFELLNHSDNVIREYANFLYENDYSLYTAKQWGVSPADIDPSVLKRVPIRFNYEIGYFDDIYQVLPDISYCHFFKKILDFKGIDIELNVNAETKIKIDTLKKKIFYNNHIFRGDIIYTGALDELFECKYGELPYRSLLFEWKTEQKKSFQDLPVVAYPQAEKYTRITEYTKLPYQNVGEKTTYAIEYPVCYCSGKKAEPYYPVLTEDSQKIYKSYLDEAKSIPNLYLCGRLADFKYYNMDQAIERALCVSETL